MIAPTTPTGSRTSSAAAPSCADVRLFPLEGVGVRTVTLIKGRLRYRETVGQAPIAAPREPVSSLCTGTSGLLDLPEEVNSRSTFIATFAELGTSEPVVNALRARSIIEPFPYNRWSSRDALDGHDLLVQSPTGSGKTLAFGVPLVDIVEPGSWGPQALVLAPTRELASQIVDELETLARARKVNLAAVYGGVGFGPQIARAKKADILVATPGRLEDLMARGAVSLDQVRVLVLDEADRMLDMGFRPAVDRIVNETPDDRQTLFFSATLDGMVGKVARDYTFQPRSHHNAPKENVAADIEHHFQRVDSQPAKLDALVATLRAEEPGRSLVFVRTERGADRLVKRLRTENVEAVAMHGDKSQRQREAALARFERGEVWTLVATDVAARGIDVPDVVRRPSITTRPRTGPPTSTGSAAPAAPGGPDRDQLRPRRRGEGNALDREAARDRFRRRPHRGRRGGPDAER